MKKILFKIIFFISMIYSIESKDLINILITDFDNISGNAEDNFIINHINDALKVKISGIKKFKPELYNEAVKKAKDQTADINSSYSFALKNSYDIIIKGFYFIEKEKIKISFTVVDVITGRIKISYSADGSTGLQIISMINTAADVLAKKMEAEIEPYAADIIELEKRKRIKELVSADNNFLIIFETGINFRTNISFAGNIQNEETNSNVSNSKDNAVKLNAGTNFSPYFYWETKTKKSFIGFGFNLTIPLYLDNITILSMLMNPSISVSYALFKKFYFNWSVDLYFSMTGKQFPEKYNDSALRINMLYLGTGFNFTYFPIDKIIGFTAGFTFYPPLGSNYNDRFLDEKKENILNAIAIGYSSTVSSNKESIFFPAVLNLGLFIFPNKKLGIAMRFNLSGYRINYIQANYNDETRDKILRLGDEYTICPSFSIGIIYRDIYKLNLAKN